MTTKERKFLYGAIVGLFWVVSSCWCYTHYGHYCYYYGSKRVVFYYGCGTWDWSSCTGYRYVSVLYLKCCDHWEGPLCDIPLCDGHANPNACSYSPGITVTTRNSGSFTTTGGTCADANVCADCNPGAYPNGPYCSACTSIDHCLHPDCTNSYNSVCKYCEGEVLEQYGWYAYTRFYPVDNHQQCRQACSWRPGSRCYPGTCDDTTTDSCRCIEGFTGPDCNTITEEPVILQNFLRLTEVTETSVNHVEAPIDSTSGSPQPVVWTNNVRVEKFYAYVDGYFKVDLPVPPGEFYVSLEQTRIGIIRGEIKLEWKRGNNFVESALNKNCKTEPPTASHRCEFEAVFKDWYWNGIFEHGDNLVFTVSVTNGGYVAVYNREASSYVEYYSMSEVTKTNVFEVWFDSISPSHCAMGVSDCSSDPLIMLDATTNHTVVVEWSGWYDDLSGLKAYHFEVFHLQPAGEELVQGDLVPDAAPAQVPFDTTEATITFPVAGPYAVTMAVYDKAGNHRTTRRIIVFDDDPKVSLQGQRSYNADMNGACTWESTPSPLLVTDASPNASCNWITSEVSVVNVVWRHRFINTKHHAGHWLDYVKSLEHIDIKLDDHIGLRRTKKVINVLGITRFQYAYNITSVVDNIQYPLKELKEIEKESLDIGVNFYDGMKLDIQVRAIDITGGYADDFLTVKMDSSPPIIEDLWLTRGKRVNISVHYIEDLTKLQIEWEAWDLDSGIDELYWRIFDNFTGQDIDHGMSHSSPQGNSKDDETCNTLYESYPGGPMCYCTHDDGCFHHHFHVQPEISIGEQNGLHESKHQAVHDSDYFIEVTATNKARLKTTRIIKITIDVSPPLGGVVQEGVKGEPELDFQQDLNVNVHWSDFFDKESGIMFYRYGYGSECLTSEDFDIHNGKELFETTMTETSFQVEQEGKYYVTVAAYNHALDHSSPVCSDGVTIDTSLPVVTDFKVDGAMVDPRLLIDTNRSFWFLHDDRTKQRVNTSSDHCRSIAKEISDEQLQEIPFRWNNKGGHQKLKMTDDQCRKSITNQTEIISTIHIAKHISLSWNVTGNTISVYNFEIGLSSTQSANPDLLKFISSEHHQHLRISHPNLNEGVHFFFVIKSISRAGVANIQAIGPFVLVTTPPTFDGEIFVEYYPGKNYLLAYWTVSAFQDIIDVVHLDYQFAVGTSRYGIDIHPFTDLKHFGVCEHTIPPTCTAIPLNDLEWDMHHSKEYFITIQVNNTAGLATRVTSKPYQHDVLPPSAGVVIDVDVSKSDMVQDIDDIDYQKSTTELSARWYGFEHCYSAVKYTACVIDENDAILNGTCIYLGIERATTFLRLQLDAFKTYKILVTAETDFNQINATSDGVTIIDNNVNIDESVNVFDGIPCQDDKVILDKDMTHQEQNIHIACVDDITHQLSVRKLAAYWHIPDDWKQFMPDVYWHIEERAPVVEFWTALTDKVHVSSSSQQVNTNYPLNPGRSYRFGLQFCAADLCYKTLFSSGVTIIPNPPKAGPIMVSYLEDGPRLEVIFKKFYSDEVEDLEEAQQSMSYYEWNIADNDISGRVLYKWAPVDTMDALNQTHAVSLVTLKQTIQFSKCLNFLLRGFTKAGSFTVATKNIKPCDDRKYVRPRLVVDCVGESVQRDDAGLKGLPIWLGINERWLDDDKDYTPHTNILSAVWPELRYELYDLAVIELDSTDLVPYYRDNLDLRQPCDYPTSILCDQTGYNFVNVEFEPGDLIHGRRYIICIHANAMVLHHEFWDEELPDISTCSDGVTVDIYPPIPAAVWLYEKSASYQASDSETTVYWGKFTDIEEHNGHVHESGISSYKIALGTSHGGVDVVPFTDVGITNHITFHNLRLQNGHSYFATVIGYDFTGQSSSSTSGAIVVDTTPPIKSNKEITIGARYITSISSIEACWTDVFSDPESGMSYFKWGVGSRPLYDDKYGLTITSSECSQTTEESPLDLVEGQSYFITVLGYNNVGLFSVAASWAFTMDLTSPNKGYVNDGEQNVEDNAFDIDYQTERSTITANWGGFSDPQTHIKEYKVSVGTWKEGQDVVAKQAIGLRKHITIDHLQLHEGITYYVSITACNYADLCATATSDGVLVDTSPPVPGKVIDGVGNTDIRYQASRHFIGSKWFGFTDPQSGLSHFTWRVGTAPTGDDIVRTREVHLNEIAVIPDILNSLGISLPLNKMIYSTVRAYNKGGLQSESSSNGFLVDDTPPIFKLPITHVRLGSVFPFTSVLRSSLKVKWDVEDKESYISRQHLSIAAHREDDFNISIEVGGLVRDYTFTRLQLHDGSIYTVKIISCNGARLCAISILQNLLIDSTPPVSGTFAINTDHAVSQLLNRQPDSWMVWNASSINLAWLGFSDIHSGILEYHINIGSSYMAMDLNMDTNQTYVIKQPATWIEDGSIQTQIVNTSSLKDKYFVFVSMWAVNRVGLISTPIHSQFYLVPGGVMQLIRRCDSHSCQGHCVCAAQDFKCKMDTDMTCYDKSGDILYANILVEDVIILTADNEDSTQITHTPTEMMLSAKWSVISGVTPLWYEWSVGRRDAEKPTGVYGTHERIWHDACTLHSWTFTLPKGSFLHDGEAYSFFIRAWFDEKTFSVFKSHGVVIQTLPPETSNIFGNMVKEIHNVGLNDVDFIAPGEILLADWEGKFKSPEAVAWYRLYISSEPIGHDIHFVYEDLLPTVTMYNLTGIYQDVDTRFYTNIIAYNHAGLHTIASSDGCQIDKDNPIAGVVYDGSGFRDIHYQNTSNHVSASWQGFIDLGSSLQTYHWCVSTADTIGSCSVLPGEDIGLATSIEKLPVNSPQNGEELVSEVWATDKVSHRSNTVLSDGVIVDSSPPLRLHHLQYEKNLIQNPSFEDSDSPVAIDGLTLTHSCHNNNHTRWYVNDDSCGVIAIANTDIVQDGTKFLTIKGSIFQAVSQLNIGSLYRLTFYSSHLPLINAFKSNTEGFVDFDGDTRPFMLYARPNRSDHTFVTLSWHLHTIVFKPLHAEANLSIGTYENLVGIAIDNIQLQESISSDKDSKRAEGHVVAHTVFIHSWSSIHASWNFYDAESGIKEYLWAIGTIQGGTQLQEFKSVGVQTFDTNSEIYLSHNTTVYTTVVAVNGAGLPTISYSYPLLVDLTPPLFEYVNDGFIEGSDVDFQSSWSIGVNFKVTDLESPITACGWGVGIQTGDISLQKFVDLPNGNYSAQMELPERTYSMKIYVTVRCKNKAGLQTTMSSDGITIKQDKPTSDNFVVEILGHSPSHYPVHANFHGTKDQFRFRWTGFAEEQWIQKYKVNVRGPSQDITSYMDKYNPGYTFASFNGMVFEDGIYEITVTAVDWLNIESEPVSTSVTVLTALPSIVDDMTIMWNNSNEKVTVSWDGVFSSDTSLYYEVSVGNVKGSGDIIQWQETKSKRLVFNLPKEDLGTYGKNVYAAVTAITPAGTFKTTLKEVLLTPPSDLHRPR